MDGGIHIQSADSRNVCCAVQFDFDLTILVNTSKLSPTKPMAVPPSSQPRQGERCLRPPPPFSGTLRPRLRFTRFEAETGVGAVTAGGGVEVAVVVGTVTMGFVVTVVDGVGDFWALDWVGGDDRGVSCWVDVVDVVDIGLVEAFFGEDWGGLEAPVISSWYCLRIGYLGNRSCSLYT